MDCSDTLEKALSLTVSFTLFVSLTENGNFPRFCYECYHRHRHCHHHHFNGHESVSAHQSAGMWSHYVTGYHLTATTGWKFMKDFIWRKVCLF